MSVKVVQVNTVYGRGSTGRITRDIHHELTSLGHDSAVLYGRGSSSSEAVKTSSERAAKWNAAKARVYSLQYAGAKHSTQRIIRYLDEAKPDVVHLQNLNGYFVNIYDLMTYLNSVRQPTVVTLHAEFMFTGGCGHSVDCERWLMVPGCGSCPQLREATKSLFLDRTRDGWLRMQSVFAGELPHVAITSVSPWLRGRAEASPILGHLNHWTVLNGVDTGQFRRLPTTTAAEGKDRLQLLHVTPFFTSDPGSWKGGRDILELAHRLSETADLTVVGSAANDTRIPDNVRFVGRIENPHTLARFYSEADAVLLTSRRETFSMVTAEALSCGTPVIGYRAGAPEQVAIPEASHFVEQGDVAALARCCQHLLSPGGRLHSLDRWELARAAQAKYSTERMVQDYLEVYAVVTQTSESPA